MNVFRASPADLRKSLEMASSFAKSGVQFVCVPFFTEEQKISADSMAEENLIKAIGCVESGAELFPR